MKKSVISSADAPAPIGPYSQAIKANGFLFISGQIALDPGTCELDNADITSETARVMNNLSEILKAAGAGFEDVVKSTIFLSDMSHFGSVNEVYGRFFPVDAPARETVAVKGLPKNVNVEISMIAVHKP